MPKKRGRVDRRALRRDLNRAPSEPRYKEVLYRVAPAIFAVFEVLRVVTAPIRGTSAWVDGMLVGIGVGAAGFVSWWYLVSRPSLTGRLLAGSAAAVLVVALLTTSGGKFANAAPDVDTGYRTFAVTYAAIGGAGMFVFLPRIRRRR